MNLTCPACNASGSIEAFTRDEAAGELINLAGSLQPSLWRALLAYVGLFRTARKLSFDKALKLAQETLALADPSALELAMIDTVESLRSKSRGPLKNHNYLKKVLDSTPAVTAFHNPDLGHRPSQSKAALALQALQEWHGDEWLHQTIAACLSALVAQNLKFAPAAAVITANADIWWLALKTHLTVETVDAPRLSRAFEILIPRLTEWPQPKQIIELLPPRPQRAAIINNVTESDRAAGKKAMREFLETHK